VCSVVANEWVVRGIDGRSNDESEMMSGFPLLPPCLPTSDLVVREGSTPTGRPRSVRHLAVTTLPVFVRVG
jgi:hypothetical protein